MTPKDPTTPLQKAAEMLVAGADLKTDVPMGLSLADFRKVHTAFMQRFKRELNRKPSPALYRQTSGIRYRNKKVRCANATYAGQLLVIVSDAGARADRTKRNMELLTIRYPPNIRETMEKLIAFFKTLE